MLKYGFKNAIALNGTSVPETIVELCQKKTVVLFVDGDRGGDLIIKEMLTVAEVDFVTKAPDGKEVEELTKKELHKALRSKVTAEQAKHDMSFVERGRRSVLPRRDAPRREIPRRDTRDHREPRREPRQQGIPPAERAKFKEISESLIGTRGAILFKQNMDVLGKVPVAELQTTLENVHDVYAVVFDGVIEPETVKAAEQAKVQRLVAMESKVKPSESRVVLATIGEL